MVRADFLDVVHRLLPGELDRGQECMRARAGNAVTRGGTHSAESQHAICFVRPRLLTRHGTHWALHS